ncbi:unnamed protein product [Dovyalis caffra]|uniref:Uncharacterized protein n=1 Tax=Dovyalis caffra TaxID=77055 RepID=A0AAV1RME4_9ROSI|nr:unnamed protein product [Dovyalis caffra]
MDLEAVKRYIEKGGDEDDKKATTIEEVPLRFFERFVMEGLHIDHIEPGRVVCSMKIPPRLVEKMTAKKPKRKIKHLISAIQSPQGLNPPNLKRLYALLHHLSTLDSLISGSFSHRKFKKCGFNFKLK